MREGEGISGLRYPPTETQLILTQGLTTLPKKKKKFRVFHKQKAKPFCLYRAHIAPKSNYCPRGNSLTRRVKVSFGYESQNKRMRLTLELADGQTIPIVNRPSNGPPMTPNIVTAACVKKHMYRSGCTVYSWRAAQVYGTHVHALYNSRLKHCLSFSFC